MAEKIKTCVKHTTEPGQSMIICQVITTLVYGGAERLLVNFCNILAEKHEVHIVYLKGDPKLKSAFSDKIKIHHIPLGITCAQNIRKFIRQLQPDVVHTHLGHADLIGLWAIRGLKVRSFCTMHNVYFKWNWIDKVFFLLYYLTFKTHARNCHVSCISKAVARHTQERLGVRGENVSINYNAVPALTQTESRAQARQQLNIQGDAFCILAIGRLRVQKSFETLLYAGEILKEKIAGFQLIIVGEGELEGSLKTLSGNLGLDNVVQFRGGTKTPEKYFAAADVFVLPSVFEGLPTVVLESFRAATPVIGSNIDGTNELIEHGSNGLLFEPKNARALADAILQLYASPSLRKALGDNGFTSYKNKYDIRNYANQMETLYQG